MGFVIRWCLAFALLAASYNPTPYNFVRWAEGAWADQTPLIVLAGLVLGLGYILFFTAILRGIGIFGAVLVVATCAALVWVLVDFGVLDLFDPALSTWVALLVLSVTLAVGMYWGILWRRLSGQLEVDEEDG
ncbi:MAG: DUF6524 family protein [Pseudomonadota bacterium]